jgi:hypothetical protein
MVLLSLSMAQDSYDSHMDRYACGISSKPLKRATVTEIEKTDLGRSPCRAEKCVREGRMKDAIAELDAAARFVWNTKAPWFQRIDGSVDNLCFGLAGCHQNGLRRLW